MSDCCETKEQVSVVNNKKICPSCKLEGKIVKIITLKSMLKPAVLDSLNVGLTHYFCSTRDCDIVYFDTDIKSYRISDIKVPVHQKENSLTVPVCYCFGWTKEKIGEYLKKGLTPKPLGHIRENIKENRCGCEVNNPQGSCCLGNVASYINGLSNI
jgi:hypothetical protein